MSKDYKKIAERMNRDFEKMEAEGSEKLSWAYSYFKNIAGFEDELGRPRIPTSGKALEKSEKYIDFYSNNVLVNQEQEEEKYNRIYEGITESRKVSFSREQWKDFIESGGGDILNSTRKYVPSDTIIELFDEWNEEDQDFQIDEAVKALEKTISSNNSRYFRQEAERQYRKSQGSFFDRFFKRSSRRQREENQEGIFSGLIQRGNSFFQKFRSFFSKK